MGGHNRNQNRKPTRREKAQASIAAKAVEQGLGAAIKPAKPVMVGVKLDLTPNQKNVANMIKANELVFVEGPAGSGKTVGILAEFVQQYQANRNLKLIVIRTPVEAGSDKIGFLPDDYNKKIEPHFQSAKDALVLLMGAGKVECDMNERIFFKIPNYALGSTWDNALVLIDEAQQLQPMIMKLLLERAGKNTKIVVAGDRTQLYVKDVTRNGLSHAMTKFVNPEGEPYYPNVDWFKFPIEDSKTRSELAYTVVHAYSQER